MTTQSWPSSASPAIDAACRRCGRTVHLIAGDGPTVCRICLFAWVGYAAVVARGPVVPEIGVTQLRHTGHHLPVAGCRLCHAARLAKAPDFDAWMRGRGA